MAVPWVHFTENALVPKIMLRFKNGDTSRHQGDSAGIFMYSAGIFERFAKKNLCPRASPMCSAVVTSMSEHVRQCSDTDPDNGVCVRPGRLEHLDRLRG